jgi:ribosomal protein S19
MNLKKLPSKKIYKLSYISPNIIRQLYLLQDSTAYNDEASVVNSRNSVIPPIYADRRVKIYTGRGYVTREISR